MNRTDVDPEEHSGALFDEVLRPLAIAKRNAGVEPYFSSGRDATVVSYFVPPGVMSMTPADFEFPGAGGAEGLINALVTHWAEEGESVLATIAPRLNEIAGALSQAAVHDDGSVDIFCYTLF